MDDTRHHRQPRGVGHETQDVNIGAVGKFGIGLVIMTVISIGLVIGVFQFFNTRDGRESQMVDPVKLFPSPQLLPNEPRGLAEFRAEEAKVLNGYGWVDQSKGVVRIPVNQAMDLLVKRGVPTRQAAAETGGVSVPTESGLGVKK